MKNVLVITLGKGKWDTSGNPSYQTATYRFEDGAVSRPTRFVGMALYEWLQEKVFVDKVVVLGTAGSIWHSLCDDAGSAFADKLLESDFDLFSSLEEKCRANVRDEELLDRLSAALSSAVGKEFACRYIPEGLTKGDQLRILQIISGIGERGDAVYIDVTHGFRHLPMLEMMSAFLMKASYEIRGIYYGAFENRDAGGITPVIGLSGLLHLQEWIEAMAVLRETGNVMPLSRIDSMTDFRADLENYQFFIQMNNVGNARGCAQRIIGGLRGENIPDEAKLFREELTEIFAWGGDQDYARRQLRQAEVAYQRGDNLRAIIMLNEAVISARVADPDKVLDIKAREAAADDLFKSGGDEWYVLRRLRNSTAHDGVRNDKSERVVKSMRSGRDAFKREMEKLFDWARRQT